MGSRKDEAQQDRLAEVLYNLVESITIGANLLKSFMPETTDKILAQLYPANPEAGVRDFDDLATFGLRETGLKVTETPEILLQDLTSRRTLRKRLRLFRKHRRRLMVLQNIHRLKLSLRLHLMISKRFSSELPRFLHVKLLRRQSFLSSSFRLVMRRELSYQVSRSTISQRSLLVRS